VSDAPRTARAAVPATRSNHTSMPIELSTPVTYLKGVGPRRAEALRRLDIISAGDLLYHLPHRYEDASKVSPIS
jgi:ATP-dependent DNA helicase RecG